jgi:tyrosyl-tRNA synthetase
LFVRAGLAGSNGEVRRAVANNGVRVNDSPVADPQRTIGAPDLNADGVIKLSMGRKKHALVRPA